MNVKELVAMYEARAEFDAAELMADAVLPRQMIDKRIVNIPATPVGVLSGGIRSEYGLDPAIWGFG